MKPVNSAANSGSSGGMHMKLSPEAYLRKHHVLTYLEDAISQMVLQDNVPRSQTDCAKFLCDYFSAVLSQNHVLFREVAFVSATAHNRVSFLKGVRNCFQHLMTSSEPLLIQELHSLLLFLCPDLPIEIVQRAFLNSGLTLIQPITFVEFLVKFELQFYLDEFLTDAVKVYRNVQATSASLDEPLSALKSTVVVVPGNNPGSGSVESSVNGQNSAGSVSVGDAPKYDVTVASTSKSTSSSDSVDATTFRDRLKALVSNSKTNQPMPTLADLDEAFSSLDSRRVKFSHFFNRLSEIRSLQSQLGSAIVAGSKDARRQFTVENS